MKFLFSLIVLFLSPFPVLAQQLEVEHQTQDHGDTITHSLAFTSPEGGLSILQRSLSLGADSWQDVDYWWGFQQNEQAVWPLFTLPKAGFTPPASPLPPATLATFLVELSPDGLILNWTSLEPSPLANPVDFPEENYRLRRKIRHLLPDLQPDEQVWSQIPIFGRRYGDFHYTFMLYRSGPEVLPPYNEPLFGKDSALLAHFRTHFPQIMQDIAAQVQSNREAIPPPPPAYQTQGFWRLRQIPPSAYDSDGDGLMNDAEIAAGTNWLAADTDGDGIEDGADSHPLVNRALADPDGCNLSPELQADLLACWDFEDPETQGQVKTFPQQSGSRPGYPARILAATTDLATDPFGMPSRAAKVGTGTGEKELFLDPGFLTHPQASQSPYQNNDWSLSFWAKIEEGEISGSTPKVLWSLSDYANAQNVNAELLAVRRTPGSTSEQWFLGGVGSAQGGGGAWPASHLGLQWTLPEGTSDDGQWHHHVIVRTPQSQSIGFTPGYRYYRNGVLIGTAPSSLVVNNLPAQPQSFPFFGLPRYRMLFGNHIAPSQVSQTLNVSFDRLRAYGRELPASQVTALFHQDIDDDGLWDITEYKTRQWKDLNFDAIPNPGEFRFLINPYVHDLPHYDHDGDGLVSLTEQEGIPSQHGPTDPADPDTDNDSIPDGWESDNALNPLSAADAATDTEPDGLTNLQEYLANTNPHQADTDNNGATDAEDTPPQWLSISRNLKYDFDDYGPSQPDAPKILTTSSSWDPAPLTEQLSSKIPYPQLGSQLNTRQPFPSPIGDDGLHAEFTAGGEVRTVPNPPCYHAELTQRQVIVRMSEPAEADTDFRALVITERELDGTPQTPTSQQVTLTVPDGETQSAPHDLTPTFQSAGPSGQSYHETVSQTLIPYEAVSTDRMFGGSLTLPRDGKLSWENVTLRFTSPDGVLGEYRDFFTNQGPFVHESEAAIYDDFSLAELESGITTERRFADLPLVFCGRPGQYHDLEFYFLSDSLGEVKIEILDSNLQVLGTITHLLTEDADFGNYLTEINTLITTSGGPLSDFNGSGFHPSVVLAGIPGLNYLKSLAIPFQGCYSMLRGLVAGAVDGFKDDLALLVLIKDGALLLGDGLLDVVKLQLALSTIRGQAAFSTLIGRWTRDFAQAIASGIGEVKNSLRRMKLRSWLRMTVQIQFAYHQFRAEMTAQAVTAILEWYDGLLERMYDESQRTLYTSVPWVPGQLVLGSAISLNYSFGYGIGYIAEQAFLGKGVTSLGKVFSKFGVQASLSTLTAAKRIAPRLIPYLTKYTASTRLAAQEFRLYLDNLRFIYTHPVGTPIPAGGAPLLSAGPAKKPTAEAFEETAEEIGSSAGTSASQAAKTLLDDLIDNAPNIKKTSVSIARYKQRLSQLKMILDGRMTDEIAEGFTKFYDKYQLLDPNTGDDFFEIFMRGFHSSPITTQDLVTMSNTRKDLLAYFFEGTENGFSTWKLGLSNSPNANEGRLIRGNIKQIMEAKVGRHKTATNLDVYEHKPVAGIDFDYGNGLFVEMKTTQTSPNYLQQFELAAQQTQARMGNRMRFEVHYFEPNGPPNVDHLISEIPRLEGLRGIEIDNPLLIPTQIIDYP